MQIGCVVDTGLQELIKESGVRLEDERIALSMKELKKHAGKGDRPLSPAAFRRIVRCIILHQLHCTMGPCRRAGNVLSKEEAFSIRHLAQSWCPALAGPT
jgi:hypothetical protein